MFLASFRGIISLPEEVYKGFQLSFSSKIISTARELSADLESLDYSVDICPHSVTCITRLISVYCIDIQKHEYAKLSTVQNTMSADAIIHAKDIAYLKDRKSV